MIDTRYRYGYTGIVIYEASSLQVPYLLENKNKINIEIETVKEKGIYEAFNFGLTIIFVLMRAR